MKKLIKWSIIIALLVLGVRILQEAAMFVFAQGYYVGCADSAEKDTKEGFRDFKRVSEMEEWCSIRATHIWEQRHQ